jgi:hypothetical protein
MKVSEKFTVPMHAMLPLCMRLGTRIMRRKEWDNDERRIQKQQNMIRRKKRTANISRKERSSSKYKEKREEQHQI